jgi:very-short-patch-repair endonuclease
MPNAFARALRKQLTPQETLLWARLRRWRFGKRYHFRRQVPVGHYIVDFACLPRRLIVEVDGSQHLEPAHKARDAERDAALTAMGFRVLRLSNADVNTNLEGCLETILSILEGRR